MKKIILGILVLFLCVFGIKKVKADMGIPSISSYQVRVTNVEGATLINYKEETLKVSYDTILTVLYEYKKNDILFGNVEYENERYTINLSDTEILKNEFPLPEKFDKNRKMYVYKEGAYLYNGPSKNYGLVEGEIMLPIGTSIEAFFLSNDDVWCYVTYEGIGGWVYYYPYDEYSPYNETTSLVNIINKEEDTSFITTNEIKIESSPLSGNIIGTIPANTKDFATFKYYYISSPYSFYYYISYNGIEGWVKDTYDDVSYRKFLVSTNLENFSSFNDELKITSTYAEALLEEDTFLYDNIDGKITSNQLKQGDKISIKYSLKIEEGTTWEYVKTNHVEGWLLNAKQQEIETEKEQDQYKEEEKQKDIFPESSIKEITIYCIIGAILIALVSFVTIRLINKKKK